MMKTSRSGKFGPARGCCFDAHTDDPWIRTFVSSPRPRAIGGSKSRAFALDTSTFNLTSIYMSCKLLQLDCYPLTRLPDPIAGETSGCCHVLYTGSCFMNLCRTTNYLNPSIIVSDS